MTGYPDNNAPMERYFNTLKNDFIHQHYYHTKAELYKTVKEFAYIQYNHNHVGVHSYNNYKTPYEDTLLSYLIPVAKLCCSVTGILNHNIFYNLISRRMEILFIPKS